MVVVFGASSAWAVGSVKLCVPKAEGASLVTPKHGKCKKGYKLMLLGAEGAEGKAGAQGKAGAEGKQGSEGKTGPEGKAGFTPEQAEQLKALLPYIKLVPSGIAGKPTVKLTGANLQVASGPKEAETNGTGNVVVGADESPLAQTGSNNLVLGGFQDFTSYGGILGGLDNAVTAPYASVSGGGGNTASGTFASVSGGGSNTASAELAAISGGRLGTASGDYTSVSGGKFNTASVSEASVSGGQGNVASNFAASISGGEDNKASGSVSWIGGGFKNEIFSNAKAGEEGFRASIFGGKELKTAKDYEAIP
jgi:hypothetical protein